MFSRKPLDRLVAEADGNVHGLRKVLGPVNLISLGVGAIVGSGIFVVSGHAAAEYTGPAIIVSMIFAAIACTFAGLCYAEFASMIPISGSAYSYAYATLGEFVAWIIGWDLILEYLVGASAVAVSWSGYVVSFLQDCGILIPPQLRQSTGAILYHLSPQMGDWAGVSLLQDGWINLSVEQIDKLAEHAVQAASLPQMTAVMNLPPVLVVGIVTLLLVLGIRASARFNNLIVAVKLIVILLFVGFGYFFIHRANWHPFLPPNTGKFGEYGWSGVMRGAGEIFFAYIGFDAVSTAAQETRNPRKHMPIGILGSLAICTVLYLAVAMVMTGLTPYKELSVPDPVAVAVNSAGPGLAWLRPWLKMGVIAGLTSVILVLVLGQSRIFYTIASDGLLPSPFAKLHSRFRTPHVTTLLTGAAAMVVAATVKGVILWQMVSIGTLLAFVIVCVGVLVLRYTHPTFPRAFKAPWVPVVPILGAGSCLALMVPLPLQTWLRLVIWMAVGLVIYFAFGRRHSRLRLEKLEKPRPELF